MTAADRSRGWEGVADRFIAVRSPIGAHVIARWAGALPPASEVLDLGCGAGFPVSQVLADAGHSLWGLDASPTLAAAWQARFPGRPMACEAVEDSALFARQFDGAVAVGLLFLLPAAEQLRLIARIGAALRPGGRLLFSAPRHACEWPDMQTGQPSQSPGEEVYTATLLAAGMTLDAILRDAGDNDYFAAIKTTPHNRQGKQAKP